METPVELAATIILLRDSPHGPEVLLQKRNPDAAFAGGCWVFPGGKLDPEDYSAEWSKLLPGFSALNTGKAMGLGQEPETNVQAFWVAAIRETFEESGLLLCTDPDAVPGADQLARWRRLINANETTFLKLCQQHGIPLAANKIRYYSHWTTPPGHSRRYNTRFLVAPAPRGQHVTHDDIEVIDSRWIRPEDALEGKGSGDMPLVLPTIATLQSLCGYESRESLMQDTIARGNY